MIEVYPKYVNQEKLEANLNKLVSAFLMVAEDLVQEEYQMKKSEEKDISYQVSMTREDCFELGDLETEGYQMNNFDSTESPLQMSLLSDVRAESKRPVIKNIKT